MNARGVYEIRGLLDPDVDVVTTMCTVGTKAVVLGPRVWL